MTDNGKIEHFWVIDIERKDGKITGTINNDPDIVHNVKLGDKITVNEIRTLAIGFICETGKMVRQLYAAGTFQKRCQKK